MAADSEPSFTASTRSRSRSRFMVNDNKFPTERSQANATGSFYQNQVARLIVLALPPHEPRMRQRPVVQYLVGQRASAEPRTPLINWIAWATAVRDSITLNVNPIRSLSVGACYSRRICLLTHVHLGMGARFRPLSRWGVDSASPKYKSVPCSTDLVGSIMGFS